jgi:hypothetical protein
MAADLALDYVRLRLETPELSGREAARQAGFSGGKPSPKARRLWKMALVVLEDSSVCQAVAIEERRLEAKLEQTQTKLTRTREWREVCKVTTAISSSP